MLQLGASIVYTCKDKERTRTGKGGTREVFGSVFHSELTQFAGVIARIREDGTADLVIFPPSLAPRTVAKVSEGEGPGQFCPYELAEPDPRPPPDGARQEPASGSIAPEPPHDDSRPTPSSTLGVPAEGESAMQSLIE